MKTSTKTFGLEKEGPIQRNRNTRCHIQELREYPPRGIMKVRRQRHAATPTTTTTASENSGARNSKGTERPKVSHRASARNCPSTSPSAMKVWNKDHPYPGKPQKQRQQAQPIRYFRRKRNSKGKEPEETCDERLKGRGNKNMIGREKPRPRTPRNRSQTKLVVVPRAPTSCRAPARQA